MLRIMLFYTFVKAAVATIVSMGTANALVPSESFTHRQWTRQQADCANSSLANLSPVLKEFKSMIDNNSRIHMLFTQMLDDEVPNMRPFNHDLLNQTEYRHYNDLLVALDQVITTAPPWSSIANKFGLVAAPIVTILGFPMNTPAGYAAFLEPDVNHMMQKILKEWGRYLDSPESANVLNDSNEGWFGKDALNALMATANAPYNTNYTFGEFFQSNPSAKNYGYKSWDDFFTRQLKDGVRPVASPDDENVIANACEAQPYDIQTKVKLQDKFWIKSQPFSVLDMLGHDELAAKFAGGTVYQAYLSPLSYHRWHAPVSGKVVKSFVQEGTYFSEPLIENKTFVYDINPYGLQSQGYLSAMATRGIIFIESDNPAIGLMAFVAIGNYEVSTIDITVKEGQHIKKGQQTGLFHFGGSSFCLLFRPEVKLKDLPSVKLPNNVPVRGQLAVVDV